VSLLSHFSHLIYFDSVALNYIFLTSCEVILASACVVLGAQVCKWRVVVLCCVVLCCVVLCCRSSSEGCAVHNPFRQAFCMLHDEEMESSESCSVALILLGLLGRLFTPLCFTGAFIFFVFLIETCDSSWCCCSLFVASSAWRRRGALRH
jgi:hypothetical protein